MPRTIRHLALAAVASVAFGATAAQADLTIDRDALGPALVVDFAHYRNLGINVDLDIGVNIGNDVGEFIAAVGNPQGPGGPMIRGTGIQHVFDGGIWDTEVKNGFMVWDTYYWYDPHIQIDFRDGPVASVGGWFTQLAGKPFHMSVYDTWGQPLESHDVLAIAPCPNNGLDNNSEFRGIVRPQADIKYFRVTGPYILMDDMTFSRQPAIACEFDGDPAQIDVFDLLAYLTLWFADDLAADMDGSGVVESLDLLAYLSCWFPSSV